MRFPLSRSQSRVKHDDRTHELSIAPGRADAVRSELYTVVAASRGRSMPWSTIAICLVAVRFSLVLYLVYQTVLWCYTAAFFCPYLKRRSSLLTWFSALEPATDSCTWYSTTLYTNESRDSVVYEVEGIAI